MAILIQVKKDGKIIHQCDQRCYKAQTKKCQCVCGGRLHNLPKNVAICKLRTLKPQLQHMFAHRPNVTISFY